MLPQSRPASVLLLPSSPVSAAPPFSCQRPQLPLTHPSLKTRPSLRLSRPHLHGRGWRPSSKRSQGLPASPQRHSALTAPSAPRPHPPQSPPIPQSPLAWHWERGEKPWVTRSFIPQGGLAWGECGHSRGLRAKPLGGRHTGPHVLMSCSSRFPVVSPAPHDPHHIHETEWPVVHHLQELGCAPRTGGSPDSHLRSLACSSLEASALASGSTAPSAWRWHSAGWVLEVRP